MMKTKYRRSRYDINKLKCGIVRVGWFSGYRYEDGTPVAAVAQWNEFGTPNAKYPIPARPFMRPMFHTQGDQMREHLRVIYRRALKENRNTMDVLGRFGEYVTSQIRQSIRLRVSPANRPVTLQGGWLRSKTGIPFYVEPKRGSHPLIDTGYMVSTVTYQLEEKII